MKVAKVVATCFSPRTVREKTGFNNNPLGHFSHSQNFTTGEDVLRLIDFTLEVESEGREPGDKAIWVIALSTA